MPGNFSEPQEQVSRALLAVRKRKAIKSLLPEEQDAIHAKNKVAQATYRKKHRAQLQHKAEMQRSINFMDLYADDIDAMPERPQRRGHLRHPEDYPLDSERLIAENLKLSHTSAT
ncbi:hypothetical protein ARMGADRAFT_1035545 [Armillaria gallica]|uniref:Uncharacterized protein n=1 Tax=Armillaria gallica TaxID=47427 RepID=A0A2H3CTK3_ARMGA|nr:hypothetical protein ARMGADRAFT_1035545 [Armillaria gallica]